MDQVKGCLAIKADIVCQKPVKVMLMEKPGIPVPVREKMAISLGKDIGEGLAGNPLSAGDYLHAATHIEFTLEAIKARKILRGNPEIEHAIDMAVRPLLNDHGVAFVTDPSAQVTMQRGGRSTVI